MDTYREVELQEKYRADIDGLRAIAVGSVLVYHAAPSYLPGGYIGVDIFFVISGFLITGILMGDLISHKFSIKTFYIRRIKRIFPALAIVLSTGLFVGYFVLVPEDFAQLARHSIAGATFTSNLLLWSEVGYFDAAADSKPLLHLWSLGVEEQFYIFWPLILFVIWRYLGHRHVLWVILILTLASLGANSVMMNTDISAAFYFPHARFWELMVGAGLACWRGLPSQSGAPCLPGRLADALGAGAGLVLVACFTMFDGGTPFPVWGAIPAVLATAVILTVSEAPGATKRFLSRRPLVALGLISYPLYLWHMPILTFLRITTIAESTPVHRVIAVGISIVLATLTYRLVERPIRFGRSIPPARLAVGLCASMLTCGGVAAIIVSRDGLVDRYPQAVLPLLNVNREARVAQEAEFSTARCFLEPGQSFSSFGPQCFRSTEGGAHRPEVLLWGDSHAAQLAPGLLPLFASQNDQVLSRLTASGCPPILGYNAPAKPQCRSINERIAQYIEDSHPSTVILAANWLSHDYVQLSKTISFLEGRGIKRVILVGPVPKWKLPLPKIVLQQAMNSADFSPERYTAWRLEGRAFELDRAMENWAKSQSVEYKSPLGVMCIQARCMTLLNENITSVTSRDESHLTEDAALYLVPKLFSDLLVRTASVVTAE